MNVLPSNSLFENSFESNSSSHAFSSTAAVFSHMTNSTFVGEKHGRFSISSIKD
jgi:hypothetical protein